MFLSERATSWKEPPAGRGWERVLGPLYRLCILLGPWCRMRLQNKQDEYAWGDSR